MCERIPFMMNVLLLFLSGSYLTVHATVMLILGQRLFS